MGPGRARPLSRRAADGRSRRSGRRSASRSRSPTSAVIRLLPGIVLGSLALGLRYNAWPLALAARARAGRPADRRRAHHEGARLRSEARARSRSDHPVADCRPGRIVPRGPARGRRCTSLFGIAPDRRAAVRLHVVVAARLARRDGDGAADLRVGLRPVDGVDAGRASAKPSRCLLTLFVGIAADVRAVGRLRDPRRADRVRLLPDRRLGGPALRRARRRRRSSR